MKVNLAGISKDKEQASHKSVSPVRSTVAGITRGQGLNFNISNDISTLNFMQLCERYENNFEYDAKQDFKLKDEIKQFGMQNAPIVVKIDDYLSLNDVPEKARQYYESKRKEGYSYYILSGHRRCRAVMSLCQGKDVGLNTNGFYAWYRKKYDGKTSQVIELDNKWGVIKVKTYVPDSVEHEEELTQIENFSSRIIQTFTWVFNAYKLLKQNEKATAEDVTEFVNKKHGVELKSGHIGNYLTVIRTLDEEFINEIFAGNLSPRDAKSLAPYFKKNLENDEAKRAEVLKNLRDKDVDSSEYIKSLLKKKKVVKAKKQPLTKNLVIELLKDIEAKKKSVGEVIEFIKNNY